MTGPTDSKTIHGFRNFLSHLRWSWFWPILACLAGLRYIVLHLNNPVQVDATDYYLPMARALLEGRWNVLLQPESYYYVPLAYLWPAIWGADPFVVRIANMGLWIGCVWFMWRTCHLLGGARAAIFAMLLMLSHEMVRFFPSELTEPLYLFGLLGWLHAMARIIVGNDRSRAVVAQGALMLTITLLSRPLFQYVAPVGLLGCLGVLVYQAIARKDRPKPAWQQSIPTIALSLGWGLLIPLVQVIKNGVVFGLWGLGTGAGIGLYLGTHPLLQGVEPAFLGFDYDVNLMVGLAGIATGDPRTVVADAMIRNAALWQLQSMPWTDALAYFGRKLWWWLAYHPSEVEGMGMSQALRNLRCFELGTLITTGIWLTWHGLRRNYSEPSRRYVLAPRQWALAAFVLTLFLAMLAQLLPILSSSRYSSILLGPWLVLLTALGLALLTRPIEWQSTFTKNRWSIGLTGREGMPLGRSFAALATVFAIAVGMHIYGSEHEQIAVDPARMGQTLERLNIADGNRIETMQGLERSGEHQWVMKQSPAGFLVRVDANDIERVIAANMLNALWETEMAVDAQGRRCETVEIGYQTSDGRILRPGYTLPLTLPLNADGRPQRIVTHANAELRPREPGYFRLVFHCPTGTRLDWLGTRLLQSRHPWEAASHTKR